MTEENKQTEIKKKKIKKPGIIYFSRIPQRMTVRHMREYMSMYGEVGKIYFQPPEIDEAKRGKRGRQYEEGWVEFLDKKVAKAVATTLNGKNIGGKRRSKWYHELWTMKYLPKFRWVHLNERLEYEKMVRKQKMQTEIRQAKKEVEFYRDNVTSKQIQERKKLRAEKRSRLQDKFADEFEPAKQSTSSAQEDSIAKNSEVNPSAKSFKEDPDREWTFKQTETDDQVAKRKRKETGTDIGMSNKKIRTQNKLKAVENKTFLKTLFSGGLD